VLVGNSFPLSLVRRPVAIRPRPMEELRALLAERGAASFWGHASTLARVSAALGCDLTPDTSRPALRLNDSLLPELDGVAYDQCWVVSADFIPGYRPAVGEEVPPEKITGWQVLCVDWQEKNLV